METQPVLLSITHELEKIKSELGSDKIATRHKAVERLDGYLNTSQTELIKICTSNLYNIKWSDLYAIVVDAIIKQSEKLEDFKNNKGYTTLLNKNPIYSNVILKLVSYSLQGDLDKRINATIIYQGISILVENRTSRENFGLVSLQIIDDYFFNTSLDISKSVGELKPNDCLQLIDYIFKIIKMVQNSKKLGLRILCKVFEASTKYFQLKQHFIKYLPDIKNFTSSAIECNDNKDTIIKINIILIRTLCIDYHKSICDYLLSGIMLQLCKLYEAHLKLQYKLDLFELFELCLIIYYPRMKLNGNLETKSINTSSEWKKILANLLTIVKTEETEFYKAKDVLELNNIFLEFSSSVLYITYHRQSFPPSSSSDDIDAGSSSQLKIPRHSSGLQKIIGFISNNPVNSKFWFAILVKLLSRLPSLIKETDLQSLLLLNIDVFKNNFDCRMSILNVKILSEILLQYEMEFQQKELISNDFIKNYWLKLIEYITQSNQNCEIEKNFLLQVLILHGKLNKETCKNLIKAFLHDHKTLKRIDKLVVLKEIFINYDTNIFEADLIRKLIEFLYSNEGDILFTSESLNILAEISTTLVLNNWEKKACTSFKSNSSIDDYKNKNILNMIEFKYLEKFIALESRLKSDNPVTSYTITNYLNECNFKILIENLNYIPIAENHEIAVNDNLIKLQKIILLNLKFTKMNVADNNTEICPIKKKFSVLFNQIELQLSSLEINAVDIQYLIQIFKNLLKTFQLLRCNSLKSSIGQENCNNIINFIKKCSNDIQTNAQIETKLEKLEIISIEIFAIIASSYKNHESFSLFKGYNFSSKNFELVFNVLQYFIEADHLEYIYGEWIVEQLKLVCRKYSTNHDVSMKILKILKPAFELLKEHDDLIEDLFIILSSFQKISYKMKYSEEFNKNLLMLCKDIGKVYLKLIISDASIRQCYIEIGKFFTKPSLLIQFSVIECIGYLLDPKWMSCDEIILKDYIDFTNQLYNTIDWKKLMKDKDDCDDLDYDTKQNISSVLMQFFMEVFAFSYDESKISFCELINLKTTLPNLNYNVWNNIKQFNNYFHTDNFMENLLDSLVYYYFEKDLHLDNIPWHFFAKTKPDFFNTYSNKLIFCALKNHNSDKIKDLMKQFPDKINRNLINEKCLIFLFPFSMEVKSINNEICVTYKQECNTMLHNSEKIFETNLRSVIKTRSTFKNITESQCLSSITENLYDDNKFSELIGFKLHLNNIQFYFDFQQLHDIGKLFLETTSNDIFDEILTTNPLEIIKYLKILKDNYYNSTFLWNRLLNLSRYYVALDMLLPTLKKNFNHNVSEYFAKDILHFTIDLLNNSKTEQILFYAIINFTEKMLLTLLNMPRMEKMFINTIIALIDCLEYYLENSKRLFTKCFTVLENVFCQIIEKSNVYLKLIEPLMKKKIFQNTNIGKNSSEYSKVNSVHSSITNFIEQPNHLELDNLKSSIFENKAEFLDLITTENSKTFSKLLGKILNIVIDDKLDNALKATECLGLIGPIHIQKYAFMIAENDNLLYQENWSGSFENFIKNTLKIVEKLLFEDNYEPTKYKFIYSLCEVLVNYKNFCKLTEVKFLEAFIQKSSKKSSLEFGLKKKINFVTFLQKNENLRYEIFLCNMMELIFESMNFSEFRDLSKIQVGFSQAIIVPLTNYLIEISPEFKIFLIELLEYFFKESADAILISNCKKIYKNKKAIKCFLDLAECLRLANNWKLPVNLLNIAKVATHQEAHFLAALYLELWGQQEIEKSNFTKTIIELRENQEFQEIATVAFKAIGCIDDINCFLNPISARLDFYNNSNNWIDILIKLDATKSINDHYDLVVENLKQQGLFQFTKILKMNNINQPIDYEICWRLSEWDTIVKDDENEYFKDSLKSMEHQLEKYHFLTLKSIYEKDQTTALRSIKTARELIVNIIKESSIECIQNLYKYLTNLMLLQHAEEFTKLQFPTESSNNISQTFLKNWKLENTMKFGNYRNKDRVNAHRIILFESAGVRAKRKIQDFYNDDDIIADTLLHMINDCKINRNFDLTKRYLEKLKSINNCSNEVLAKANLQDAEICWITNQKLIAKKILKSLMAMKEHKVILQRIEAYHLYGKYLSETNDEGFDDIYSKYLMESTKMTYKVREAIKSKKLNLNCANFDDFHRKMISKNYNLIAKYADNEYLQIDRHINSERFRTTVRIKEENQKHADKLKFKRMSNQDVARDIAVHSDLLKKNSKIDEHEINYFQKKHSEYLVLAVENYIKFSKYDDSVISPAIYRLISLWLTNKDNENLRKLLDDYLMDIPTYKFICVLTQLTAHLNSKCVYFTATLEKLLFQISIDHPHHSLSHVISLKNAYLDNGNKTNNRDNRTEIAERIINKIRNKNECVTLIDQLENMSVALIEFANVKVDPRKPKPITTSTNIRNLINLDKVHCPTKPIEIQRSKKYNIVHVLNWSEQVKFAGGANMPKRIFCKCSNGITYQQLLKGNDDLRQDAVMQQIFHFVNVLLIQNNDDCNLKLRIYEIKPLSKCSGILEWCINTVPIGNYLVGEKKNAGAHAQYYPDDLKPIDCCMLLQKYKISQPVERLKQFEYICSKYHPVFQYFFFEKYSSPGVWFEKRNNYMTSLASSSMVGFILGLGDRHCQNILIDELTAEIIHIDFGIAFERGKTMPTPETVPFRLTRDIVAPMGICHLDGIFRKSCETTLKILRENHQPLLTILEVLLYDPLYCWTLNEKFNDESQACLELKNVEDDDENEKEEKNAIAQRALIRVQTKLEGLEDMKVGSLSIENQVQKLIAEAMSFKNLCLLYHGWQPFC